MMFGRARKSAMRSSLTTAAMTVDRPPNDGSCANVDARLGPKGVELPQGIALDICRALRME